MCRRFDSAPRHHRPASAVGPSTADFRRRATPALSGDRTRELRRTQEPAETGRWCSVRAVVGWSTDTGLRVSRLDGRNRLPALGRPSHRRLIAGSSPARPPAPSPVIVGLEAERPPRTPLGSGPNAGPNALPALRDCGADRSRERRRKGAWRGAWSCRWTGPDRAGVPARGPGAHRRRPGAPRRASCRSSPPGWPGSRSASPARRPPGRGARRQEGRTGGTTGRDCRETTGKGRRRPPCP